MAVENDQRIRDIQREYLDFLDDDVSTIPYIHFFGTSDSAVQTSTGCGYLGSTLLVSAALVMMLLKKVYNKTNV